MTTCTPAATPALKTYRVVVLEWLSHTTVIEAPDEAAAEAEARRLWAEGNGTETFSFEDSGLDGVVVEEL